MAGAIDVERTWYCMIDLSRGAPIVLKPKLKVGDELWVPAEIRLGPFAHERRVYLKIGDNEWLGFANESEVRDEKLLRVRVLGVKGDSVVLGIRGISPHSRSFRTERATLIEHGAIAP
ncbi:MAG TPA: hypothetical protein VGH29_09935 [Candidatus Binataceae bacterium]